MKTLYIDVYFLLNFSVDLLAVFFSLSVLKIPTRFWRLLLCGFFGAIYAVFCVFLSERKWLVVSLAFLTMILMTLIIVKKCSLQRRLWFCFYYLIFEITLAGATTFIYRWISTSRRISNWQAEAPVKNRNFIYISLILLLGIGILELIKAAFSKSVLTLSKTVAFSFFGKEYRTDALVDSGNLLCDPLSGIPVMLTTKKQLSLPVDDTSFSDFSDEWKNKIRMIPYHKNRKTVVLYAIKPDTVTVQSKNGEEEISLLIAFDKEEKDYGGFESLLPYAAIANVS